MDVMYHLVTEDQSSNNHILRTEINNAKCLYTGPIEQHDLDTLDADQLLACATVDNFLMKFGPTFKISNVEVYANGCINMFIKNRALNQVVYYATIRPSVAEKQHYDDLAEQHGQSI